ncbi:PGPGW domain-containing protein [Sneathiella glossodoripedis]|uniref:PGPGW domain-containing protein n=1 Tax=Sneathiella glossodoripedis TaxID=418853 RepID=UPI000470F7BE|nr:PGPGW domain-containing protein [Sneathiella glossodoripedis]
MSLRKKIENLRDNVKIPESKTQRFFLGWGLVFGGIFGFLPVVGFWMLPLGIMILAVDYSFARRLKRKTKVWLGRMSQEKGDDNGDSPAKTGKGELKNH